VPIWNIQATLGLFWASTMTVLVMPRLVGALYTPHISVIPPMSVMARNVVVSVQLFASRKPTNNSARAAPEPTLAE
jgi:hypothetical protein